jgi:hypothetical protein
MPCGLGAWHGGILPRHRRKPAESRRLLESRMAGRLAMDPRRRKGGGNWEDVEETVCIVLVPCRFGGTRPYFICPGVVNGIPCDRRVVKLHGPERYFLYRHCYRLVHASQSEGAWGRAMRRANKIRIHLGGEPGMASPFHPVPRACGDAPMNAFATRLSRPSDWPTRPSSFMEKTADPYRQPQRK